jgi:hypothetical protein
MIDIGSDHLIAIRDVPKILPARCNGKRIHISAVYRWLLRGVRGTRLDSITIGGTTYTSTEAVQQFADQLSQARSPGSPVSRPSVATPSQRRRQIEEAARRVGAAIGEMPAGSPRVNRH